MQQEHNFTRDLQHEDGLSLLQSISSIMRVLFRERDKT